MMNRRDFFTLAAAGTAAALGGCAGQQPQSLQNRSAEVLRSKHKKRVVIVGGGFAGLNTASAIRGNDPEHAIEVIVVERNSRYFACPMSNTLLSGDERYRNEMFLFDYVGVQRTYGYEVVQADVVGIDRDAQRVHTSSGWLEYDLLVLSPGIEYDYESEFPHWSAEKIRRAKLEAPGGLISDVGVEHSVLRGQLEAFRAAGGEGEIVIVPPRLSLLKSLNESVPHPSLQRCKPASYERACMIADWIRRNGLVGKARVRVLDSSQRPQAKPHAFEQVFEELYPDIIEYVGGFELMDVDFDAKTLTYRSIDDDAEFIEAVTSYDVLNLIPLQRASSLIAMAGLKHNAWGGAILAKRRFYSVTDDRVYVLGDSAWYGKGHFSDNPQKMAGIPAAAQTAYSSAKLAGAMIARRLLEGKDEPIKTFSASCFSMVESGETRLGIAIYKDFDFSDEGMVITEEVPKENGKYYTETAGEGLPGWFEGVTADTFARF